MPWALGGSIVLGRADLLLDIMLLQGGLHPEPPLAGQRHKPAACVSQLARGADFCSPALALSFQCKKLPDGGFPCEECCAGPWG